MVRTPISKLPLRIPLATLMLLAPLAVWAQDRRALSLPQGMTGNSGTLPSSPGGTGLSTGEPGLSPGLPTGTRLAATRRPVRPATRRSRNRVSALSGTAFRSTIIAPGLTPNVQPQLNGAPDPVLATAQAPAIAVRRRPVEDDPYASLGIRLGGLTLFPMVGQAIGYDTNPNRTATERGSFVSQTEAELRLQTDWSRHELTGALRGAYNEYPQVPGASRPEGAGRVGLRLDVDRDTQVNLDGRFQIDTQRQFSPDLNTAVQSRPVVFSEGASVGVTHRFNRLVATLRGTVDRSDFEDARAPDGSVIDQSDRNFTQYGARGRLGYEIKPGLVPFVEALGDTRVYDRRTDNAGFRRNSEGVGGRAGTTFELTRLVTGEVGIGAVHRFYEDPRLGELTSPLVDASVVWAPTPLTTVRATASATVDETTVPGANGVRVLKGGLEVAHALRRNLTVTAGLTAADYEYNGAAIHERSFGATLRAEYKLTRSVAVRASYAYERLDSSLPGSDYTANVFLVGMRFQP